jgi:hypothetical protein
MSNVEDLFIQCSNSLTVENLSLFIDFLIKQKQPLQYLITLCKNNIVNFQSNKDLNSILSTIIYYHSTDDILTFLPTIKTLNYRFDKMYLHYAFLTKKTKIIDYLLSHGCPLRPFHLQSTIKGNYIEYVKTIIKKFKNDQSFGERIQKSLPDWLLESSEEEIYKLCIQHCSLPSNNTMTTCATNRNYILLFYFLELYGLQLPLQLSTKLLDILYTNLVPPFSQNIKPKYGIFNDVERVGLKEKSSWYKKCVEWCEFSPLDRYKNYIQRRNKEISKILEDDLCNDILSIIYKALE